MRLLNLSTENSAGALLFTWGDFKLKGRVCQMQSFLQSLGGNQALVAQRIELFRPKEEMGVQFPPRAPRARQRSWRA